MPAISLAHEPQESTIMENPPRDLTTDRLVSGPLLLYAYGVAGVMECLFCFISYSMVFWRNNISLTDLLNTNTIYWSMGSPQFCAKSGACFTDRQQVAIVYEGEVSISYRLEYI